MIRAFDFVSALIGLILWSPLFVLFAIVIKLDSRGGVYYLQKRVGKNNKEFLLYKFRTMYSDADKKGQLTIGNNDSRITRVGQFLRKYKIDELPQLINVLKGDMSLVGPRPEVRKYVDLYNPIQLGVLTVRPGITDYASIEFSNENEILQNQAHPEQYYIDFIMPRKLDLNLKYIAERSLLSNIKIIFKTFSKILN
jgi:lipopolysaccharide/colanic/teichoic acid biosynthesis glycosyltransferase